MSRKQISTRTRFEIFKRDSFACQYCGQHPPAVKLHVDHILAVANGGTNDTGNLTTACEKCNLGKSAVPLSLKPKSLEETAEDAKEMAAQVQAHGQMIRDARDEMEEMCWEVANLIQPGASDGFSHDSFNGIMIFVKRLGYAKTLESAYVSLDRGLPVERRFKYFCGVCWNAIRSEEGGEL